MHVSLKGSNKHPSLYLHAWKMSFIKDRHLEFLAHNYDRATKFCALVGWFTQMGSMKSYDDAYPVLVRQFYVAQTLLDSFWELGGGVRGGLGWGGALITSTQDRCGGNRARRPFSHKFVLVNFNHFERHYAWFIEYYYNGENHDKLSFIMHWYMSMLIDIWSKSIL